MEDKVRLGIIPPFNVPRERLALGKRTRFPKVLKIKRNVVKVWKF